MRTALTGGPPEDREAAFQELCERGVLTEGMKHDFQCQMRWLTMHQIPESGLTREQLFGEGPH
jgi:hypothetical protein